MQSNFSSVSVPETAQTVAMTADAGPLEKPLPPAIIESRDAVASVFEDQTRSLDAASLHLVAEHATAPKEDSLVAAFLILPPMLEHVIHTIIPPKERDAERPRPLPPRRDEDES